ncbi:hypothetical protein SprV_0301277900 [Sparganum proliferum]
MSETINPDRMAATQRGGDARYGQWASLESTGGDKWDGARFYISLFSLVLSAMLVDAHHGDHPENSINCRADGQLPKIRRVSSQWTSIQSDLEEKLPQQQQQMFVSSFQDSRDSSNSHKFSAPSSVPSPRTLQQQSQSSSRNQQSNSLTPVTTTVDPDSFPLLFETVEVNHSNTTGAGGSELFGFYDNIDGLQEAGGGGGGGGYLVITSAARENSPPGRSDRGLLMSAASMPTSGEDPNQPLPPPLLPVDGREETAGGLLTGSSQMGNLLSPSPAPASTTAPPPEVVMTTAGGDSLSLLTAMAADAEMVAVEGTGATASSRQKACSSASSPQWILSADGGDIYTVPCAAPPPPMVSLALQMVSENQNPKSSVFQRSNNSHSTRHSAGTPQQDELRQFYSSDDIEASLFLQQ